jgi:hypothetical protein
MLDTPFYIACLKLTGRRCVVVGGGEIGLEKVEGLLACDGGVVLVAPEAVPELQELAHEGSIAWERREYRPEDLEGTFMVIACTDDTDVNIARLRRRRAPRDARQRRRRAAAVQLHPPRDRAHRSAGDRHLHRRRVAGAGQAHEGRGRRAVRRGVRAAGVLLNDVRGWAKGTLPTYQDRKVFFEAIVNGEPDPIDLLRAGDRAAVRTSSRRPSGRGSPPDPPGRRRLRPHGRRGRQARHRPARRRSRRRPDERGDGRSGGRRGRRPGGRSEAKGDVLGTARIAGIQAAKRTGELIPLCHPLGLDHVDVRAEVDAAAGTVTLTAEARVTARTGVEMEAMTAAASPR